MKQPKLKDLVVDHNGTETMREAMAKVKKIRITVHIDEDILKLLRKMADSTGVPYQRLLNRFLRGAVYGKKTEESRLERLEKELALLKKKLS